MAERLAELLVDLAARRPDLPLFTFLHADREEESATAARLQRDARILATLLRERGVRQGEIVPLVFDHGYDLVRAFWGALYLGAVPTILPYVSRDAGAKNYVDNVRQLVRFTAAPNIVTTTGIEPALAGGLDGIDCRLIGLDGGPLDGPEDGGEAWRERSPALPPYIQFSSGSTGIPKGVAISQTAVLRYEAALAEASGARADDVMVGWLPLYHDMGLTNQMLRPLSVGHVSVMMSPSAWLGAPERLFLAVHRHHGTVTWMPNFAFAYCARRVRDRQIAGVDLSSWRLLGNASEPVFLRELEEFARRFAPFGLRREALTIAYGLAEHVAAVTHTRVGAPLRIDWVAQETLAQGRALPAEPRAQASRAIVTCGAPIPGARLRIVDESGGDLPERSVGEILVAGPCVFDGYHADPDGTAAALRAGWLHSGDLGYLADGELFVCGRRKDLIISAGRNLHPNHLEDVAAAVLGADCRFAAAFGIPDARLGTETPVIVCEMRRLPDQAEQARLREATRAALRREQAVYVSDVHLVEAGWIPKTTSGKINRSACRERYLAEQPERAGIEATDAPADATPVEARLRRIWQELFGWPDIAPDDDFFEIGGDSLLAAELMVAIEEEFGLTLPNRVLLDAPTIAGLARLLAQPPLPAPEDLLVPLLRRRAQPLRPAFFCVHGIGGGVLDYRPLSQALGPEQAFYAIQAIGLDGKAPLDASIEEMAGRYVEVVRAEQPRGPYHLGGYCFGGVVAFEMARRLVAEGERVALLAILEGWAPRRAGAAGGWQLALDRVRGLPFWLGDYLRLERMELRARLRRVARRLGKRALRLAGARVELEVGDFLAGASQQSARFQRALALHLEALRAYAPLPYGGERLVVFRTARRLPRSPTWDRGWSALASAPIEVETIPGAHATILQEPHVRVLAEKLATYLRA